MANLTPNELRSEQFRDPYPRIMPSHDPGSVLVKRFAAVGAAPEYAVGTPVTINTSTGKWQVWDSNGSNGTNEIHGFVYPDKIQTHATLEVHGQVLTKGQIHYADIWAVVEALGVEVEADLKTALRTGPRGLGLAIQGLDQVR